MAAEGNSRYVFVNCPFDGRFELLFHVIVFTVLRCGFQPRCALETSDAGDTRISKIGKIIEACPYGIHDISRTELDEKNGLPRFNMPFELGLFLGAKAFGSKHQRDKRCLVLEREPYAFQKYLSDIAGQDIYAHGDDRAQVARHVRDFLNSATPASPLPGVEAIMSDYAAFEEALPKIRARLRLDERLSYPDFLWAASDFISRDRAPAPTN